MRRPIDMRGRRAAGGGVVPYLYVPSQITAPSLSGGLSTGGVLTITPAVWLGGTSRPQSRTWQMQRAGVDFGAPLTVPTYTAVAADSAVALTVKEIATNPIGPTTSDASNAITVPAITTWAGSGLTYTAAVNRKPVADSLGALFDGAAGANADGMDGGTDVLAASACTVITRRKLTALPGAGELRCCGNWRRSGSAAVVEYVAGTGSGYQPRSWAIDGLGNGVGIADALTTSDTVLLWTWDGAAFTARLNGVAKTVVASGAMSGYLRNSIGWRTDTATPAFAGDIYLRVIYDAVLSGANQVALEALVADAASTLAQYQALGTVLDAVLPGAGWA